MMRNLPVLIAIVAAMVATTECPDAQEVSQRTAPQTTGLDKQPIVTNAGKTVVIIGTANAAQPAVAETNSYNNAVYRAATELNQRLFDDPRAPLSVSFADLEDYVRRFARVTGKQTMEMNSDLRVYTRLEMHDAFLDPLRIRSMSTASNIGADQAEGYLLAPAARLAERAATEILIRRVPVRSVTTRNGSFQFLFSIRAAGAGIIARLDRIEVEEDGSAGDATWEFVITGNAKSRIVVPAQRYNNDRPAVSLASDARTRELQFGLTPPNVEIRIAGTRK